MWYILLCINIFTLILFSMFFISLSNFSTDSLSLISSCIEICERQHSAMNVTCWWFKYLMITYLFFSSFQFFYFSMISYTKTNLQMAIIINLDSNSINIRNTCQLWYCYNYIYKNLKNINLVSNSQCKNKLPIMSSATICLVNCSGFTRTSN